jgi:RNA polymerase sigma-70 factor (ECF subfamily)
MASGDFEHRMLPHLGAAYSLARWLLRNPHDAEDAVQEAMLRAFKSYATYAGGSPKAWLLAIVRNTCMTAIERRRAEGKVVVLQDVLDERERGRPLVGSRGGQAPCACRHRRLAAAVPGGARAARVP